MKNDVILNPEQLLNKHAPVFQQDFDDTLKRSVMEAMHEYAKQTVLQYARWFEDQGPPEYRQDDWMVKQNVE